MCCLRLLEDDAENVKPQCGFTGIYHCTWLKGLKFAVVCYFQGRIINLTNLLNYVAPSSIELMVQI